MQLYRTESSDPKCNAQRNLSGRTHYVDDGNLRFHHSRVLSSHVFADGLLFAIVTSDARDMNNAVRGFRYVIFDVFGNVVERNPKNVDLQWFSSSDAARTAMRKAVVALDAHAVTLLAADRAENNFLQELRELRAKVGKLAAAHSVERVSA